MKKIVILIPCLNEEKGIGNVIDEIPVGLLKLLGYEIQVIVINNNSTGKTAEVARQRNVKVIHEEKPGKGNALRAGFESVEPDTEIVVMLDGDNTYKSKEILRMVEPIASGFCDVVVGSRLGGKVKDNSLKFTNRLANWSCTFLVRQIYRANIT